MPPTPPTPADIPTAPGPRRGGPLRLGVVAYLNVQPLVYGLAEAFAPGELELHWGTPSALAGWLEAGTIDMGMVPTGALLRHPEWRVAGNSMIGTRGAVKSVLILGDNPPQAWRRLHPDSHSLTSNALARILLERRWGAAPGALELAEPIPAQGWTPPERPTPQEGLVLIGSRALRWRDHWRGCADACVIDMGEAWTQWTGLPFVFAVWAVRPGVDLADWPARLEAHRQLNLTRLPRIAAAWPELADNRLTAAEAEHYFTAHIDYTLDAAARAGLQRYYLEGHALGLFSHPWAWCPYEPAA